MKLLAICLLLNLWFLEIHTLPLRLSIDDNIENYATGVVKFYLYTKSNPKNGQELVIGNADSVKRSNFDKNRQTKIIIHGWGGSYLSTPNQPIRDAYFSQSSDFNIISVDWSEYAKLNYVSAKAKVPVVGQDVAQLIDYLNKDFGLNFSTIVVIGHSLGAHVAGFSGKNVKNGRLGAIVGLDPAFPLYTYMNTQSRLASSDASYVQTIQTNGNVKGFLSPIGSASFYPNWGRSQPGCGSDLDGTCAHSRCWMYYAEALRGLSFKPIYKCNSFDNILNKTGCTTQAIGPEIGDPLQISRVNGIFYFETNSQAPFGK